MRDFVPRIEVEQASEQFIAVVEKAINKSGMDGNQAAGRVSYLINLIYDRLKAKARRLPRNRPPTSKLRQAQEHV